MRSRFWPKNQNENQLEINMSPLIDIVFMLLIFFIVTAVFTREESIEITRPSASSAQRVEQKTLTFDLSESGRLFYRGDEISIDKQRSIVQNNLDTPVIVRADAYVFSKTLITVIDTAKLAGAANVSVATVRSNSDD